MRQPDWQTADGAVRLFLGDCLELLPQMEPASVEAMVTDPPYGLSNIGERHVGQAGCGVRNLDFFPNDTLDDGFAHVDTVLGAIPLLTATGTIYAWLGHHQFAKATLEFHKRGWQSRFLVWNRVAPCPPPPWSGWPSGASLCLFAYRAGKKWAAHPREMPRSNVLTCDSFRAGSNGKNGHPTQMNPLLVQEPIRCSTEKGDVVLDPFMGSCTTGETAVRLGRRFIGIEKEPKYFDIAVKRIEAELQRTALFEPPPQIIRQANLFNESEVSP